MKLGRGTFVEIQPDAKMRVCKSTGIGKTEQEITFRSCVFDPNEDRQWANPYTMRRKKQDFQII
jgi:hypothetical protein